MSQDSHGPSPSARRTRTVRVATYNVHRCRGMDEEQTRQQVQLGARFNGVVVSMQEQTALVDIGGLDATVPMSELQASVRAMGRSEESLKVGQRVEVEVTKIEEVAAGNDHWHHSFQGNLRIGASHEKRDAKEVYFWPTGSTTATRSAATTPTTKGV